MKSLKQLFAVVGVVMVYSLTLFAGNTGKIIGKVVDAQTKEPIVSVNVLVVNTRLGSVTDFDGKFAIIGVPIGTYTVRASQVGYRSQEITNVKVGADETTSLNFTLVSEAVEVTGVTVTAEHQLVNPLTTSSTQTVSAEKIESIPNVKSVEDVLKLQAGVVKQGNNLFLRGGRANEVKYLVDGMATNNIVGNAGDLVATDVANKQLADLYAGVQSGVIGGGVSGLSVSASAIQSVSVQTSGFDADYGDAQSGIINIVTKSGSDKYSSSMQYRTDKIPSDNQNETFSSFTLGGPEPLSKYLLPSLGVKFPGSLTFFFSTDISRSDGPYQYVKNEFYNPIERRVELNGLLGGILNGLGFRYRENQRNSFTFNTKLKYDLSSEDQFSYGYRASLSSTHGYQRAWKYRADSSSLGATLSIQNIASWTHFFGAKSFIKVHMSKLAVRDGNDVAGLKPMDYSPIFQQQDVNDDGFSDLGSTQRWYSSRTSQYQARVDFNSQVHPLHFFKTGFEFNYEDIRSTEISQPTVPLPDTSGTVVPPPFTWRQDRGEYPGYGVLRWALNNYSNRGALFVQDNIEFSGLNLHVGLRYDYLDIGKQVFDEDWVEAWRSQTGLDPECQKRDEKGNCLESGWAERDSVTKEYVRVSNNSTFWWYFTHGYFSPRLAIGYPVTDRIVFYFNYGHFLQFPDRDQYYRDPFVVASNNWIGNPNLKPQRSVSYEAAFEDQFTDDMAFALRAFYKDIFDYTTLVTVGRGNNVSVFQNLDYASVRGFEVTLNQAFTGNFSANLSYSYQIAKGRSSNSLAAIFEPQFRLPREVRLDYDQSHTANLFVTYRVGPKEEGKFFGLPFTNNYGISLTWNFGSGFPFSGYSGGRSTLLTQYLKNSETKPYTSTVNLTLYKGFEVFEKLNVLATLDITNLLNRKNVANVYNFTGRPTEFGDYDPSLNKLYPWYQAEYRLLDPTNFEAPRQIFFGVRLNWE
ncbi:MAG: TonB-dependent receptor [Ignavibacteriae bacterium]|nr:TonB-dependent receptor [Ignavibacteriota bacterium]